MAEEETGEACPKCKTDKVFDKILAFVSRQIGDFVAFLFILITLGAIYGVVITTTFPKFGEYLLFVPALIGLIAYYNRDFATIVFILLGLIVIII